MKRSAIQLYGYYSDYSSFARVSRALAWAFRKAHVDAAIKAIDQNIDHYLPVYIDTPYPEGLNSADIGIAVAWPEKGWMWLRGHETKILFTVCEANSIPRAWVNHLNEMALICVPSVFCQQAFKSSGVKVPVEVIPHGIGDEFEPMEASSFSKLPPFLPSAFIARRETPIHRDPRVGSIFYFGGVEQTTRILHVSGALSYPQRKGTPQILLAFRRLRKKHPNLRLVLAMRETSGAKKVIEKFKLEDTVSFAPTRLDPEAYLDLYRSCDAVLQPSRGEGFGMVPLEARACGIPVILTAATGHAMHFAHKTDIEVKVGPMRHIKTNGNDTGLAPTVTVQAVVDAVEEFLADPVKHKLAAMNWALDHRKEWLWDRVLAPFVHEVKGALKRSNIVLGAEAGLRGAGT